MLKKLNSKLRPILRLIKYKGYYIKKIKNLAPWYQTFNFFYFLKIYAIDKTGSKISPFSLDRGIKKWDKFIQPYLPFSLKDKRILEIGSNSGLFLYNAIIKHNAKYCCGVDSDTHYLKQAYFLKQLYEKIYEKFIPVEFINEKMEKLNFNLIQNFDICIFLQSIYHINNKGRERENLVLKDQVALLNKISKKCKYFIFLGNSLEDEGRGKGIKSLNKIINKSKLKIIKKNIHKHPRGYLVIAESSEKFIDKIDINLTVNKYFKKPQKSAEYEFLTKHEKDHKFNYINTLYYLLRTGKVDWNFPGVTNFPKNLSIKTNYWVMPWAKKIRKLNNNLNSKSVNFDKSYILDFYNYIQSKNEYINKDQIEGYLLINKNNKKRFIYTDGNHRMAFYKKINNKNRKKYKKINIKIIQTIYEKDLLKNYITVNYIKDKTFTKNDAKKWFGNAFNY